MSGRVEHIGDATLYLSDCRDLIDRLPADGAVVSDPPYGVGYEGSTTKHGHNGFSYESFDDTPENIEKICVPAIRRAVSHVDRKSVV